LWVAHYFGPVESSGAYDPCNAYRPPEKDKGFQEQWRQNMADDGLQPHIPEVVVDAVERASFENWVALCGKPEGIYERR
jgi:hypothetical protein